MGADSSKLENVCRDPKFDWICSFSPGFVLKLKDKFESDGGFTLSRELLMKELKCTKLQANMIFEHFDMDGNGDVDTQEFTCAMILLSNAALKDKAEAIFKVYDLDKSKNLEKDELAILMTNVMQALNSMRKLAPPMFEEIEEKTDEFFARADLDQDRVISLQEFQGYISRDRGILEILLSAGVIKREELGFDFSGGSSVPVVDPDLEGECFPPGMQRSLDQRRTNVKEGKSKTAGEDDGDFVEEDAGEGDQFMAVKPWLGVVKSTVPTGYKYHQSQTEQPEANLELDHVHGYRCHDCRNNLRYTPTGEIVYHAAAVGVVLNQSTNQQKFFIQHTDDIISMAVDPTGRYCATGQLGKTPAIYVWDTSTMDLIATASGTLKIGIKQLSFSPDGNYLAATGFDEDHSIAIYQWSQALKPGQNLKPVASGKGSKAVTLSIGFTPDSKTHLIVTGVREVNFVSFQGIALKTTKGSGLTDNPTSVLCQAFVGSTLYTGLLTGEIAVWNGTSVKSILKAHTEGCHSMYPRAGNQGLITGGGDGNIIIWSNSPQGLQIQREIKLTDKASFNCMNPKVRSVCESKNGTILVGTRGGEVIEIDKQNKPKYCVRSHHEKELWGVATHPTKQEYITVGQDMILAVWDIQQKKQRGFSRLPQEANVVAYSNNGKLLVIGMINGEILWLDANNFTQKAKSKPTDKEITVIKFSPDDLICAIGTADAKIVQFDVTTFKGIINFKKHSSRILHCDWSLDGKYLMSMCSSYSILFSEVRTGKQITATSQFKDEKWSTWTCTLGWSVQGIWPPCANGTDINAVDRSPDGTVIATADDFGIVKLFKYPCPVEKQSAFKKYFGHSSHVTNIRFMKHAPYLITTGGEDKCIFQWRYNVTTTTTKITMEDIKSAASAKVTPKLYIVQDSDDGGFEEEDMGAGDQCLAPAKSPPVGIPQYQVSEYEDVQYESLKEKVKLEEAPPSLAVQQQKKAPTKTTDDVPQNRTLKPVAAYAGHKRQQSTESRPAAPRFNTNTKHAFVPGEQNKVRKNANAGSITQSKPSKYDKGDPNKGEKPQATLRLSYAHGYRGFDTRNNLKFVSENEIVFSTAALGVVMDLEQDTQRFFNQHEEDIVCLAIHPTKKFVATANMAEKGQRFTDIYVWDVETLEECARLNTFHEKSVRQVLFSPSGQRLLTIGTDEYNSAAVYDWASGTMLCSGAVDKEKVFDCSWRDEKEFVTCGKMHIKIHTIQGRNLVTKSCTGVALSTFVLSCQFVFASQQLVAGASTGELLRFAGTSLQGKPIKAHTNGLWVLHTTIDTTREGEVLLTGGNDGMIYFWNTTFTKLAKCINLTTMSQFKEIGVRAIDFHQETGRYLVGTRASEIIEIGTDCQKIKTHINGHFDFCKSSRLLQAEVWGLAVHPTKQIFASCGADQTIRIWEQKSMIKSSDPEAFTHDLCSLDWASNGKFLVAGDRNGYIFLIDAETLAILDKRGSKKAGMENAWIEDVKISPCCGFVAFGTHGGVSAVDIAQVAPNGKKFAGGFTIDARISSAVTHLDWSQDCQTIMVNSQAHELNWVNVQTKKTVPAANTREIEFQTWTSIWGFTVAGIWPADADFTDVNSVCRSNDHTLLASGDDFGRVKLFKYPCWKERALCSSYRGHSSHVTEVKFTADDRFLVSTGGQDKTVLVWEVDYGEKGRHLRQEDEEEYVFAKVANEDVVDYSRIGKTKASMMTTPQGGAGTESGEEEVTLGALTTWKTQTMPPTWFKKPNVNQEKKPLVNIDLEWIHGFNSRHIGLNSDQSIIYHSACVGIQMNQEGNTQRFFTSHNDEITAIAFSTDKRLVATGDSMGRLYIWDSLDMSQRMQFKSTTGSGILSLSFSPSGSSLVALSSDDEHTISLFDTQKNLCRLTDSAGEEQITGICMRDDTSFVTSGMTHFKIWTITANTLSFKKGVFNKNDPRLGPIALLSPSVVVTGAITGALYLWKETEIAQAIKIHDRPIEALHVSKDRVFTSGKDKFIQILTYSEDRGLTPLYNFTVNEFRWESLCGRVRALCYDEKAKLLYVGTQGAEVYQVPVVITDTVKVSMPKLMVQGHYSHPASPGTELKALGMHPKKETLFVTAAEDCTLRVWDTITKKQVHCTSLLKDSRGNILMVDLKTGIPPSSQCSSLDMSPDGKSLLLGFKDGSLKVFGTSSWESIDKPIFPPSNTQPLKIIKFSPCGLFYAAASLDKRAFLFTITGGNAYKPKAILKQSTMPITALDWSLDSQYLHTSDQAGEVLYYKTATGQPDSAGRSACKDETWATWTQPIGWHVTGIAQEGVITVDRYCAPGSTEGIVVVGMTNGAVRLYRYPSVVENSEWAEGKGKHTQVSGARFTKSGQTLITIGLDNNIYQWKLTFL